MPTAFQYLWHWYIDLSDARTASGFAVSPIGWGDMRSYSEAMELFIKPWEYRILRDMDKAVVNAARDKASRQKSGEPVQQEVVEGHVLTPEIFGAMFGR